MNKLVIKNLQEAFHKLGIDLAKSGSFYEFEYEHIPMLLSIDSDDHNMAFITYVVDSSNGSMNENVLNTALDVVERFYKDCCCDWNEGTPFFVSPCYSLKGSKSFSPNWLKKQLKAFYDAFLFLEANIQIVDYYIFLGEF